MGCVRLMFGRWDAEHPGSKSFTPQGSFIVPGSLHNFNTEKSFKDLDKADALKQVRYDALHALG